MLGTSAFADIKAKTLEEAWPFTPPSQHDLNWLRMSDGKKVVWKIADPLRPDSVFKGLAMDLRQEIRPLPSIGEEMAVFPPQFTDFFDLNSESTPETNLYHAAASILAQIMLMEGARGTVLRCFSFISHMDPRYRALLERRDPRAMLLLAYWYAKVLEYGQWWIWRRAVLEGPAICLYFERVYPHDERLLQLSEVPKAVFDGFRGISRLPQSQGRIVDLES
jgi:hypothetical protein